MKHFTGMVTVLAVTGLICAAIFAVDSTEEKGMPGMPPMGAPEQMKEVTWLVGDWDFEMKWRMSDSVEQWVESKGLTSYELTLDGCALIMHTKSENPMGPVFKGMLVKTYDRESGVWQAIWVDNMAARISYYEGTKDNDKMVMTGEEKFMGQVFHSRMTIYNQTEKSYDWKMETSSDGGETYWVSGMATYTKR